MESVSDGVCSCGKIVEQNTTASAAAVSVPVIQRDATSTSVRSARHTKTILSTFPPPVLVLALPAYGERAEVGGNKRKKANAGVDRRKGEAVLMSVRARRKTKMAPGLFPATDEDGEEDKDSSPRHTRIRRRRSEAQLSEQGSSDVVLIDRVVATSAAVRTKVKVRRKMKKAPAFCPSTDEHGSEENDAAPTFHTGIRKHILESPFFLKKGYASVNQLKMVALVRSFKAKRMVKMAPEILPGRGENGEKEKDAISNCHAMIIRCGSKPPEKGCSDVILTERAEAAVKKREEHRTRSSYTGQKVHETADISSQEWRKDTGITRKTNNSAALITPLPKKMKCTPSPAIGSIVAVDGKMVEESNTDINKNMASGRAKKKLKKNREMFMTRTCEENTKEIFYCHNDGIGRLSLDLFDNMVKGFQYTGNKMLEEPLDCVESHVASANATMSSTYGTKPLSKSVRRMHRGNMSKAEKLRDCYLRVNADNMWVPPHSPYELLQEDHSFDPWRILVICMLLNQTTGEQVKKILRRVFLLCPTAEAAVHVPENELRTIITSLGLQNKRVRDIHEMSRQYLEDGWTHVTQLHGVGKYAADSYAIFCVGKPEDVVPNDHMLVRYWKYVVHWKREQQRIMDTFNF